MNNLRKFETEAEYSAATLNYPSVSWVTATDNVYFDKTAPAVFSGLTVHYNITDTSQPTELFNGGGGGSGSGSGSGSGGVLPSAMMIDGTAVEVTNTYQFSTTGEHIVNYSFADNQIPDNFLDDGNTGKFSTVAKVEIGDAITSIGNNAFFNCTSLTSCTIGSGVTSIGTRAFEGCSGLTSVTIGSGVTSISNGIFYECRSLTSITVDSNNTSYSSEDGVLFNKAKTILIQYPVGNTRASYNIPNSVISIEYTAFYGCTSLTSCTVGSGVTSIGNYAFSGCTSLSRCTIGSSVTSIGNGVFHSCTSLTSIVSNAATAPTIQSTTFRYVKAGGTLTVPSGSSGYDVWMQYANYYLGLYGWTKVEQ